MGTLIDSSVLVAAERGKLDLSTQLAEDPATSIAISAITASELLHGVHRASSAAQRARRESFVERILESVPVIPFDLVAARVHARLWADLAARGIQVGAHDLTIAASALAIGFGVATRDMRSFPKIPGLTVERW
ncbi:MAG: type II toxin-antitoxin system VapC family toxin [Myxococcota bacterium]|nr:type II toxin-antitoxin system VapC family toxin [Myxococcota bacterium]